MNMWALWGEIKHLLEVLKLDVQVVQYYWRIEYNLAFVWTGGSMWKKEIGRNQLSFSPMGFLLRFGDMKFVSSVISTRISVWHIS